MITRRDFVGTAAVLGLATAQNTRPPNRRANPIEIYDLNADPSETRDVAAANPTVVEEIRERMRTARRESPAFPIQER